MTAATERLNRFLIDLPLKKSLWQSNFSNPYVRAYDLAYENFQKTLKEQAERNRLYAEFFVFAASVLTGSVMMAVFATSSLRALAGRALLSAICNNNLNRTFDAVHAVSNNRAAMFALGKVLDQTRTVANRHITAAVRQLTRSASIASSPTAINYLTRMDDFINTNHICVHSLAVAVRDDAGMSDDAKNAVVAGLETAPFFTPPASGRIDENALARKMELLFYMSAILDSDQLVRYIPNTHPTGPVPSPVPSLDLSRTPIAEMPSATNYPRETFPAQTRVLPPVYRPGQRIDYDNIGSTVRDRVDTLHRAVVGSSFYADQSPVGDFFGIDPTRHSDLVKAERLIARLAAQARPADLADVRTL